jgi:hypothetical protein
VESQNDDLRNDGHKQRKVSDYRNGNTALLRPTITVVAPSNTDDEIALFGWYSALGCVDRAVMLAADTRAARYGEQWQKSSELFEDEAPKALGKFPEADQPGDEKVAAQARSESS